MRRPSDGQALPGAPQIAACQHPKGPLCRALGLLLGERRWEWARVITSRSTVDLAQNRSVSMTYRAIPGILWSAVRCSSTGGRYGQRSPRVGLTALLVNVFGTEPLAAGAVLLCGNMLVLIAGAARTGRRKSDP